MFYDLVKEASDYINNKINSKIDIGTILGSGLGDIVNMLDNKVIIPYKDIPNFPLSKVEGHAGNFVIGSKNNKTIAIMQGRFHYYEGFTMKEVCFPIYVMKLLGVKELIITNACGAINTSFTPGDIMIINDYINMIGQNSLIGDNDERFGPRFPDMSEPYSIRLMNLVKEKASILNIDIKEGVYGFFSGPCFESKAEIKAYKALGADCVGMSTVPETICANYLGIEVLGLSCITNMATGIRKDKHSHLEVLDVANKTSAKLSSLIKCILE